MDSRAADSQIDPVPDDRMSGDSANLSGADADVDADAADDNEIANNLQYFYTASSSNSSYSSCSQLSDNVSDENKSNNQLVINHDEHDVDSQNQENQSSANQKSQTKVRFNYNK